MRRAALLLLLAAPLALAACGGSGHTASPDTVSVDPVKYVRGAAIKTARAPSEHMTMTGRMSGAGMQVTLDGSGDFSNAQRQGTLHATFSAGPASGGLSEVLDKTTVYLSSPLFGTALPSGKTWVKLDLAQIGKANGIDFSALMSQSPSEALARLTAAGSVTNEGPATIDGVQTTHYRVRIDPAALPQGAKLEALTHAKYEPLDIWVDQADGYVRRMTTALSFSAGSTSATMSMTMSFSNFGEAVHVTVPSAGETVDFSQLGMTGLGG